MSETISTTIKSRTIVKKIVVGTPVRSVTGAQQSITSITDLETTGKQHLDIFVYDSNTGKYTSSRLAIGGEINETYDSATNTLSINLPELATAGSYGSPSKIAAFEIDSFGRVITAADYLISDIIDSDYIKARQNFDSIDTDLIPDVDSVRSLGSPLNRWKDLWLTGNTLYIGSIALKDVGGTLTFERVNRFGIVEEEVGSISAAGVDAAQNLGSVVDEDFSGITEEILDTFSTITQRSAKYFIQMEQNTTNQFGAAEILLIHDSSNVYLQEFAKMFTGDDLGSFDAILDSDNDQVKLLFTPSASNVSVKAKRLISGI